MGSFMRPKSGVILAGARITENQNFPFLPFFLLWGILSFSFGEQFLALER